MWPGSWGILERSELFRRGSPWITERSSPRRRRTTGLTGTAWSWTSPDPESRWTTPMWRHSTACSGESASHSIGSSISRTPGGHWRPGGRTTTTTGLTAAWGQLPPADYAAGGDFTGGRIQRITLFNPDAAVLYVDGMEQRKPRRRSWRSGTALSAGCEGRLFVTGVAPGELSPAYFSRPRRRPVPLSGSGRRRYRRRHCPGRRSREGRRTRRPG